MFNVNKIDEANLIAIDTETCDPNLKTMGPGGFRKDGFIAVSYTHLTLPTNREV